LQWIDQEDVDQVARAVTSDWITQGPKVREFESALSKITGSQFSIAVNSGTSALHISCMAIGVQPGDEVITSTITFVASANCAVFCGGKPVFADIDTKTYNLTPEELRKKITSKTKAVIPVHFAGQSCDMEGIYQVVKAAEKAYGTRIYIIEDASHALGSYYKGTEVGACKYADITVLSFHPVKHITTGEGGAALTNDESLYEQLRLASSHGITRDPKRLRKNLGPWYYEQVSLGYNYRITDIQCALGVSQLKKLPLFRKKRREIVDRYNRELRHLPFLTLPFESETCDSNFHLYVVLFDFEALDLTRNALRELLIENQILTQIHYIPVHTQPYFQENYGTRWGDLPNAEAYFQKCLSLPLYPAMNDEDVARVIQVVTNICKDTV